MQNKNSTYHFHHNSINRAHYSLKFHLDVPKKKNMLLHNIDPSPAYYIPVTI